MSHSQFIKSFLVLALLSFISSAAVTYLYNLLMQGTGYVDWQTSFRFAILFGLALTWVRNSRTKKS